MLAAPPAALAQSATPTASPGVDITPTPVSPPGDADLEAEPQAETLPGDGISFNWEQFRQGLVRAFTFNPEKKAKLFEEHLHRLDRKLAACSELGDEECVARIEARIATLKTRAEKYMEKREELRQKHLQQFQEWRQRREVKLEELKTRLEDNKERFQELRDERREHLQEIKERREQLKENRQERSELRQEQRAANRDQLIELRSKNVKRTLDTTHESVQERKELQRETLTR